MSRSRRLAGLSPEISVRLPMRGRIRISNADEDIDIDNRSNEEVTDTNMNDNMDDDYSQQDSSMSPSVESVYKNTLSNDTRESGNKSIELKSETSDILSKDTKKWNQKYRIGVRNIRHSV